MERHYFPLTFEQKLLLNVWAAKAPLQMLNMPVRVDIHEKIDEEKFLEAYRLTVERLPYCRLRFHKPANGETEQYVTEMEEQTLCDLIDATEWSEKKLQKQMKKWSKTPFANKALETQLVEAHLFRRANGEYTFYFCGLHIITDLYALVFVVRYLDEVYYALTNGLELPKEGVHPEVMVNKHLEYMASERHKKDDEYWFDFYDRLPRFTTINGADSPEFIPDKPYGKERTLLQMRGKELKKRLPVEMVQRINAQAAKDGTSPYAYYLLALRSYLSNVCRTDDVALGSVMLNRGSLEQKTSGMTRATCFYLNTKITGEESFSAAALAMGTHHADALRHISSPRCSDAFWEKFYPAPKGKTFVTTLVSYAPFLDYNQLHLNISATKIDSGIAIYGLYMLLIPADTTGDFSIEYQYAAGYIKPKNIEKFHAFMLRFLEAGLANPDATVKQLTAQCI